MRNIILSLLLFYGYASAQAGSFVKYFGDPSLINTGNSVYQLSSGSIYAVGSANSNVIGGKDLFLTKFDANGDTLWTKYYGTTDEESCSRMVFNGKYFVICGQTNDILALHVDGILVAVDTLGKQLWLNRYGSPLLSESLLGLCNAIDGGFIASGFKSDSTSNGINFWLIKTDSAGTLQWEKVYGDTGLTESSDAVLQLPNGDILLSGDKVVTVGTSNAWLLKTDSLGKYIWDRVMNNPHNGGCKNLLLDKQNNIIVIGEAATDSSSDFDIQITKSDLNGNLIWLKYVRASNQSDAGFDIVNTPEGNYMLTGYYYDTTSGSKRIQMMLLDTAGNELNRKLFAGSNVNIGYQIIKAVNGGYLICGTDFQNNLGVLIYDDVENPNNVFSLKTLGNTLTVYPNPSLNGSFINLSQFFEYANLEIYDMQGSMIQCSEIIHSDKVSIKENLKGIFLMNITERGLNYHCKLIIESRTN